MCVCAVACQRSSKAQSEHTWYTHHQQQQHHHQRCGLLVGDLPTHLSRRGRTMRSLRLDRRRTTHGVASPRTGGLRPRSGASAVTPNPLGTGVRSYRNQIGQSTCFADFRCVCVCVATARAPRPSCRHKCSAMKDPSGTKRDPWGRNTHTPNFAIPSPDPRTLQTCNVSSMLPALRAVTASLWAGILS